MMAQNEQPSMNTRPTYIPTYRPTDTPEGMCITQFGGISAVINGGILFVLPTLPMIFYCLCQSHAEELTKQDTITSNDQKSSLVMVCCNCFLIVLTPFGLFGYLALTALSLNSLFNCGEVFSTVTGVFISLIVPFNVALFIGVTVAFGIMLGKSCKLNATLCCNYK